jgi:hypothetical protein
MIHWRRWRQWLKNMCKELKRQSKQTIFWLANFQCYQICLVLSIIPLTIDDVMTKERLMTNGFRVEHSIIGIPTGHSWWTIDRRYLLIQQAQTYVNERIFFKQNAIKKSFFITFEIRHIEKSNVRFIMWDWSWQYGLEDTLWHLV